MAIHLPWCRGTRRGNVLAAIRAKPPEISCGGVCATRLGMTYPDYHHGASTAIQCDGISATLLPRFLEQRKIIRRD